MSPIDLSEDDRRDLMAVINEESDRLNRLVGEAAEMARLESHEFQLDIQPQRVLERCSRHFRFETGAGEASHGYPGRARDNGR